MVSCLGLLRGILKFKLPDLEFPTNSSFLLGVNEAHDTVDVIAGLPRRRGGGEGVGASD